jgi:hypothetical protein
MKWLSFIFLLLMITPAFAQDDTLYETFDDPDLPGWELSGASVEDGILLVDAGNSYAQLEGEWSDFAVSLRVRQRDEGSMYVLRYHVSDAGAYEVVISTYIAIFRYNGRSTNSISVVPLEPSDDWQQIELRVVGNAHEVIVDGEFKLFAVDPDPLPAGRMMIGGGGVFQNSGGEFDDLSIVIGDSIPPLSPMGEEIAAFFLDAATIDPAPEAAILTETFRTRYEGYDPATYGLQVSMNMLTPGVIRYDQMFLEGGGHGTYSSATIDRYITPERAQSAFDALYEQLEDKTCGDFHDLPACWGSSFELDDGDHYRNLRWFAWLSDNHLFIMNERHVGFFNNTPANPMPTAEIIYALAVEHGLIPAS